MKVLSDLPSGQIPFLGVIINSAGGAPAQTHLIWSMLESIKKEANIPVYTFAEDAAISAGYYLLASGKKSCRSLINR
jgi:ClpP class serine protease